MANSSDYTQWRQQTIGGIKYRFLSMSGNIDPDQAEITWSALFRAVDLINIVSELFPPPNPYGLIHIPQAGVMPGLPSMAAKRVSFKSQDGNDLPIDPFLADPTATAGTYGEIIQCDVNFGYSNKVDSNPADPRTFLELSANMGGDFIHAPPTGLKLQPEENSLGEGDETLGGPLDKDTAEVKGRISNAGAEETNKHPGMDATILVPTTEWSVVWKQIPFETFRDVIVWRLRALRGRVNSAPLPFLLGAPAETVLFTGFRYKESYSWRTGKINVPPIDVEMRMLEKQVVWKGIVAGHNHVFEPGKGWVRALLADGNSPYRKLDFNIAFQP